MKYQPFLDLPAAQYGHLKADIEAHGVLVPILVDEVGHVIDGHQRRRICAELHIDCPAEVIEGLTEDEKHGLAVTLNLYRRHLSGVERSQAVTKLAQLGWSTRRIADFLQTPKSNVHRDVHQLSQVGQLDRPETTEGLDGRRRPATRPTPPPGVDVETGEIVEGDGREPQEVGAGEPAPSTPRGTGVGGGTAAPVPDPLTDLATQVANSDVGYRDAVSKAIVKANDLLTLDPERTVSTRHVDDRDSLGWFLDRLDAWSADVRKHMKSTTHLKAVP